MFARRKRSTVGVVVFLSLIASVLLYGRYYEARRVVLTRVPIVAAPGVDGPAAFRIVHFSDLHFQRVTAREERVRALINGASPDVLVFTGDLFNSRSAVEDAATFREGLHYLRTLQARRGLFVVLGEQEYAFREYLDQELRAIGVSLLDDKVVSLEVAGGAVNLVGLTEDPKTLDNFFRRRLFGNPNVTRFQRFARSPEAEQFREYRFRVAGQYALRWHDYDVTGTLQLSPGGHPVDLAVYAQVPMGQGRAYVVELDAERGRVSLAGAGTSLRGRTSSDVSAAGRALSFRVAARTFPDRTVVRLRVWPEGLPEPDAWMLEGVDDSRDRVGGGTIGLRLGKGTVSAGQIRVERAGGLAAGALGEGIEGVLRQPVDDRLECLAKDDRWMTVADLEAFVAKSEDGGRHMLDAKLRRLLSADHKPGFTILLSHRPRVVSVARGKGVDLVLAGHTQGGQVVVPLAGRFFFDRYEGELLDRGLKQFGGTQLYINRGIGTSFLPIRLGSVPEVTVYEIESR